ncbi:unnamed protein product, partial [Discosporangium mesarthrocarpum]
MRSGAGGRAGARDGPGVLPWYVTSSLDITSSSRQHQLGLNEHNPEGGSTGGSGSGGGGGGRPHSAVLPATVSSSPSPGSFLGSRSESIDKFMVSLHSRRDDPPPAAPPALAPAPANRSRSLLNLYRPGGGGQRSRPLLATATAVSSSSAPLWLRPPEI